MNLKECSHCGGEAKLFRRGRRECVIACNECCIGTIQLPDVEAINIWNKRIKNKKVNKKKIKTMDRNRPYNGQSHTDCGKRGKTIVQGLTMRDICDCYVRGVLLSASHIVPELYDEADKGEKAKLTSNDLFGFDLDKLSPGAICQNMMCEVEKMMGIYPNIPKINK